MTVSLKTCKIDDFLLKLVSAHSRSPLKFHASSRDEFYKPKICDIDSAVLSFTGFYTSTITLYIDNNRGSPTCVCDIFCRRKMFCLKFKLPTYFTKKNLFVTLRIENNSFNVITLKLRSLMGSFLPNLISSSILLE